jgi:hypothetical protein
MFPNYYYPEKYPNNGVLVFQIKITNVDDDYFSSNGYDKLFIYLYEVYPDGATESKRYDIDDFNHCYKNDYWANNC